MSFKPLTDMRNAVTDELPVEASGAVVRHSLCKMAAGYLVDAAAGDDEVEYLALQTVTGNGTDGGEDALVWIIDDKVSVEALVSTTPVQATHVGNDYDLTDGETVNLAASTDKVFHIDAIVNATDKLVRGHFNKPALA